MLKTYCTLAEYPRSKKGICIQYWEVFAILYPLIRKDKAAILPTRFLNFKCLAERLDYPFEIPHGRSPEGGDLWGGDTPIGPYLQRMLKAHLFELDKDYIIRDQSIVILSPNTGRTQERSRWSDGVHQVSAIPAANISFCLSQVIANHAVPPSRGMQAVPACTLLSLSLLYNASIEQDEYDEHHQSVRFISISEGSGSQGGA